VVTGDQPFKPRGQEQAHDRRQQQQDDRQAKRIQKIGQDRRDWGE